MPRQGQLLIADAVWKVVCHQECETAKSKCGKYSFFILPESSRENQKLIFTL